MLKKERLIRILNIINQQGIVTVNDIVNELNVSNMTIRRDLDLLEKENKIIRVHGGAQSLDFSINHELSHIEKSHEFADEKEEIACTASELIKDDDVIFIGPGTTTEFLAKKIYDKKIKVVTNSLSVFNVLKSSTQCEIILIGGEFRNNTETFVGPLAHILINKFRFNKTFISCNGIFNNNITNFSPDEGEIQALAFNRANQKYLLADAHKFNHEDIYDFYDLNDINGIITNKNISPKLINQYSEFTKIIN